MIHVAGEFVVRDPSDYLAIYTSSSAEVRRRHGCLGSRLYRVVDDDHAMVILLSWPSRADFDGFQTDPAIRDCMRRGGMLAPPVFSFRSRFDLTPDEISRLEPIGAYVN